MPGISAVKTTIPFSRKGFSASAYWTTRNPTNLVLTAISESRIDAVWDDAVEAADGLKVYWSLDNVTWTLHRTALFGAEAYSLTSLPEARRIYVKVVAYKDANESDGATANDYTAMKILLTSLGLGTGVSTLRMEFKTSDVVATLSDAGRFYSDAAGTLNESTSYTFPFGSLQTRYLKVTTGTSNLLVFHKGNMKGWGGALDGWSSYSNAARATIALPNMPRSMTALFVSGTTVISGAMADKPPTLSFFYVLGNTVSGMIHDLYPGITFFLCEGTNTIDGSLSSIPAGVTYFKCTGNNTINQYTGGRVWSNSINYVYLKPAAGYGLDSTEVDNVLIDLAAATWAGGSRRVELPTPNAARTAASDAAVATLLGKSVSVVTA